jgi:hypothetical protein
MLRGERLISYTSPLSYIQTVSSTPSKNYQALLADREYQSDDLLILCRIDHLLEQGQITEPVHKYLSDLYSKRVDAERDFWEAFNVGDDEHIFSDRITEIDTMFLNFGVLPREKEGQVKKKSQKNG